MRPIAEVDVRVMAEELVQVLAVRIHLRSVGVILDRLLIQRPA